MELPKLNEIFSPKKSSLFLALKIESTEVKSAVWSFNEGKADALALGDQQEWIENKEELLVACDASIAAAVTKLKDEDKRIPHELILGLPGSWVQNNKVSPQKLADLHFVTKKLSLSPMGFVVNPEAITHALINKEKDFFDAILVYLGAKEIVVSLIEDKKLIQSESVGRSDNLVLDVEEGILRFSSKNLPSRILLYNSEDLEEARQTLISYPWQPPTEDGKPGFLHLPRVEVLPKDFDIEAIVFAGGEEIRKTLPETGLTNPSVPEEKKEEESAALPVSESEITEEEGKVEEIEFVKDEDILEQLPLTMKPDEKVKPEPKMVQKEEPEKISVGVSPLARQEIGQRSKKVLKISGLFNFFRGIPTFIRKSLDKLHQRRSVTQFSQPPFLKLLPVAGLGIIAMVLISFYFLARAKVGLMIEPNIVEKEFTFKVDPKATKVDLEKRILPAKTVSVEINDEKTAPVTGKKTVGEKAKGEVVIYNRTDQPKKFTVGSAVIGPGKLKFVLDSEVSIASKTPDLASGIDRWGETKTGVVAADIGAQYNLAANSQFTFEDLSTSSFLAKNLVAFLGGTSRQITVVSKEDQEKLLTDLIKELNNKARVDLEGKVEPGESIITETINSLVKTKVFDREIQEEASSFSLKLSVASEAFSYRQDDLKELLASLLTSTELSDQEIEKERTEISVSPVTGENGLVFNAKAKIALRQKTDTAELAKQISGKTRSAAETRLLQIKSVKTVSVEMIPGFFSFLGRLPFDSKKIGIEIKVN